MMLVDVEVVASNESHFASRFLSVLVRSDRSRRVLRKRNSPSPCISRTPLQRIKQGAVFLTVVFVVAVCGYHFLGDYDWDEAIWMVVVTISTVGYAEHSTLQPLLQVFTVFVILLGMSAAAYTFGGLIQLMLEGEIDRAIGRVRMTKELKQMSGHIIICGFGRIGQNLAAELESQKTGSRGGRDQCETAQDASSRGFMTVVGDATEESVLRSAGIERAGTWWLPYRAMPRVFLLR